MPSGQRFNHLMIYGIGTDLIQVARIQQAVDRHGERFAEKILGSEELQIYRQRNRLNCQRGSDFLATRFAAKEAFAKALGFGMRAPMRWDWMQTLNQPNGRPAVITSDQLKNFMQQHRLSAQISISDQAGYAIAFVIVEQT